MKVTIEIDSESEMKKLSALFKTFDINNVKIIASDDISVIKGDKSVDPKDLFGIWADKPRSLESIRKDAWNKQ
jgi:hypothetical protein